DALIIKYGDPGFERAISAAGTAWGVERFAYATQAVREANMLADAVDAGARFAVANCEPNDGGGWGDAGADRAIRSLIDAFRRRHASIPLYICADLRRGRSRDSAFAREAARGGADGWMPMVYPKAFGQTVPRAFDAAFPGASYLGLPCMPVIQVYDAIGPALVREQIAEARARGATALSVYVVEAATDEELRAVAAAKDTAGTDAPDAATLNAVALAYLRGAIRILHEGTPTELRAWADRFVAKG
ncbi:MAG TPA: hypothetical protein VNM91_11305, partial [Dehalococcoidia bacterium]|nr:hypothetical protein [Dehalococcoidia bacterium]